MSFSTFITTVESDLADDAATALAAAKASAAYVEGVLVNDIAPELGAAFVQALETFGGDLLKTLLGQLTPGATVTVPASGASAGAAATGQ